MFFPPQGELCATSSEKRAPNDFALWKASKPGEPAWDSPWGQVAHVTSSLFLHLISPLFFIPRAGLDGISNAL